jgi:SAM-dependent methyltransferase
VQAVPHLGAVPSNSRPQPSAIRLSPVNAHSIADSLADGRLSAPSALRNAPAIVAALADWLPLRGRTLEIAAGTGEHAVALARANPGLDWQPTDIDPERLASIDVWRATEGVENMRVAARLDATTPDWRVEPVEVVFLANLMHLVPETAAANVIRGAARALLPGGRFCLYGPFRTGGDFRSRGDATFHARLTASDPSIGYKDLEWIEAVAGEAGLVRAAVIEMPANNLIVIFDQP